MSYHNNSINVEFFLTPGQQCMSSHGRKKNSKIQFWVYKASPKFLPSTFFIKWILSVRENRMGIFCSFTSLHPLGKEEDGNEKHQNELSK